MWRLACSVAITAGKGKELSLCCVNGSRHRSDYSTFGNGTSSRRENKSTSMEGRPCLFFEHFPECFISLCWIGSVCSKSGVLCDCGGALETSQDCCFVDLGVNLFYLLERCCALFCIIASERKNPNRK